MAEDRETHKTTYEDLLMDSIYHMRLAKREGEEYIFDELLDEVEMLFSLVPELKQLYLPAKQELERLAAQNIQQIKNDAATIDDDILKDLFLAQKTAIVKWDFRTDMLETVLNLMNDYQMLPYKNPYIGELSFGELEEVKETEEVPYEEVPEEVQPPPQPQHQVPQSLPSQPPPADQGQMLPKKPFPKRKTENE